MSPTLLTLTPLKSSDLKETEKAMLDNFVNLAGEQTYLSQFLSEGAVEWLKAQITNDFGCDLYDYFVTADKQANEAVSLLALERERAADVADKVQKQSIAFPKSQEALEARVNALSECSARDYALYRKEQLEKLQALGKVQAMEQEILRLKARVLDLQDKLEDGKEE